MVSAIWNEVTMGFTTLYIISSGNCQECEMKHQILPNQVAEMVRVSKIRKRYIPIIPIMSAHG